MRLNLNDNIKVKLTEHGKDIYYHQYDRLNNAFGKQLCKPSMPKVDEDGYTTFQLWCFMELYGVHMGMTLPNVIEPLDIVFDAPTIDPVRRGKWIDGRCSQCGGEAYWKRGREVYGWREFVPELTKYCPDCGSYNGGEQGG